MSAGAAPRGRLHAERVGLLAMLGATLIWGGTFVVLRDSLPHLGPLPLVLTRFTVASATFALLLLALRRRPPAVPVLRGGALAGLVAAGCFVFQSVGLTTTSAGSSAFLTYVGTALAALFAWPLLGERPRGALIAGLLAALAGAALLTLQGRLRLGAGELWTLLGAALYGLQVVVLARVAPGRDPLGVAAVQSAAVMILLLPWGPAAVRELARLDPPTARRLAYLAIPATVIAPWLQIRAQQALPAGRIALLFALEPLFALVFALTLGHERFAARWWLGAALILGGVAVVEARAMASPAAAGPPASG